MDRETIGIYEAQSERYEARRSPRHRRSVDVPLALADLHGALAVEAPIEVTFFGGDPKAPPGPQARTLGARPVYLAPSTSGANASAQLPALVAHLEAAARLADR